MAGRPAISSAFWRLPVVTVCTSFRMRPRSRSLAQRSKGWEYAHITAFSFYVTKNICTGEGGMLTTDGDRWADELRVKSLHGISKDAWKRYSAEGFQPYETIYPGYKFNMMDIQAAHGYSPTGTRGKQPEIREHYWSMYDEAFAGCRR